MDVRQKIILLLTFLIFFDPDYGSGQVPFDSLFLSPDCKDSISCRISFKMPDNCYSRIRDSRGLKYELSKIQMICNGSSIPVSSLSIRGKTSLYYPKKSFTVKLDKKIDIISSPGTVRVKDCYLIGLTMDENYIHNYIAFTLMDVLDLFNLVFGYCEVVINDETQGIYLITERPRDYALKTVNSPAIIRRGYKGKIDKLVINKNNSPNSNRFYIRKFNRIYTHDRKYSGRELYDSLDSHIDMDQYMRWLAFNFLTRNGDYTDEIFLYIDPADDRFRIIPWDYDDVFSKQPHEGYKSRRRVRGGKFIFSSEDRLDRVIITDEYLYLKYLEQLLDVIEILNDVTLAALIHDAYCAIYPYYLDGEIMKTTRHDKFGSTNLAELNATLLKMLSQFRIIRNSTQLELIDIVDHSPPP